MHLENSFRRARVVGNKSKDYATQPKTNPVVNQYIILYIEVLYSARKYSHVSFSYLCPGVPLCPLILRSVYHSHWGEDDSKMFPSSLYILCRIISEHPTKKHLHYARVFLQEL